MDYFARGSSGGGRASSSARSSSSKSSSKGSSAKATQAQKPKTSTKPTTASKTTTASAPKTVTGIKGKYGNTGHRVGDGYQPRFNGYTAPPGSVVYYPQHSALDYLPWILLFSQNSPSHDQAMVVQPDGKQVVAEPPKGIDGMVIFNWVIVILFLVAILGGIVWLVNKKTQPRKEAVYAW